MSEAKEIWEKLSSLDCNEHKKQKGQFDYLPWNFAWATLMEHYPEAEFKQLPDVVHTDQSVTVNTEMTIGDITRPMWLAVTDFKNNGVQSPSCDEISDARMRCFTKNMAMFGLGYYIYQGEGLPREKPEYISPDQLKELTQLMLDTQSNKLKFCALFKIKDTNQLLTKDFDKAVQMLNTKKERDE